MAKDMYTISKFGKDVKYKKVGDQFFRVKADGSLAKSPASGLVLANLRNQTSPIVTSAAHSKAKAAAKAKGPKGPDPLGLAKPKPKPKAAPKGMADRKGTRAKTSDQARREARVADRQRKLAAKSAAQGGGAVLSKKAKSSKPMPKTLPVSKPVQAKTSDQARSEAGRVSQANLPKSRPVSKPAAKKAAPKRTPMGSAAGKPPAKKAAKKAAPKGMADRKAKVITAGPNTGFGPKGNIFPSSAADRKRLMAKYGGTGSAAAKAAAAGKQGNLKKGKK